MFLKMKYRIEEQTGMTNVSNILFYLASDSTVIYVVRKDKISKFLEHRT